ncbi:MAG: hypothetical protein KIS92_14745 [Planctomycetota bacterium]|nr:hypothetical protein [Planctomycetota bacterium]
MPVNRGWAGLALIAALVAGPVVKAETKAEPKKPEVTDAEYNALKKEVEELRKRVSMTTPVGQRSPLEDSLDRKYGPNAGAVSRQGKLTIGGLVQVWYYSIQNDNHGWVDDDKYTQPNQIGSNEVADNDSFRVRRAEIKFTMDIHENFTAVVMIDPAREATSFPSIQQNTSNVISGDGVANYNVGAVDTSGNGAISGAEQIGNFRNNDVRTGAGQANRMLQDAYINVHGIFPHHDTTVGQFKRRLGEEGTRDSSQLDFVERSMITQLADMRDLGSMVHGSWWDDRFQYWLGAFDGSGTAFQQRQNRADDNDERDWVASFLVRPLWKQETWGSLELGYSIMHGIGGEAAGHYPFNQPVDGLNRNRTVHQLMYAWAAYMPGGPVRGWWLRGEWGQYRDRFAPGEVVTGNGVVTLNPAPFSVQGWYVATGYKIGDSVFKDKVSKWFNPFEFVFRYEKMQNLFHHNLAASDSSVTGLTGFGDMTNVNRKLDVFSTTVFTAGFNYYIVGNNAKIQLNYNWVGEETPDQVFGPQNQHRQLREVSNNSLVANFQVAW